MTGLYCKLRKAVMLEFRQSSDYERHRNHASDSSDFKII